MFSSTWPRVSLVTWLCWLNTFVAFCTFQPLRVLTWSCILMQNRPFGWQDRFVNHRNHNRWNAKCLRRFLNIISHSQCSPACFPPQQLPVYFHPCSRSCSTSVCASEIRLTWPQNFLHLDLLHLFCLFGTLLSSPNKSTWSNRPIMQCPCFHKISVEFLGKSPQFKDQPAADSCPTERLPWWWDSHLLHRSPASAGTGFLKVAIRLVVPA